MSYPDAVGKQGTDRFTPGRGERRGERFTDPLRASGPNSTNDHYPSSNVPPGKKNGGGEPTRTVRPHTHNSAADPTPTPRSVTSPGKLRRVKP